MTEIKSQQTQQHCLASVGIQVPGVDIGPFRIGGPGLANLLWLWAKCIVFSHLTGAAIVWPQWNQLKPRSLLRGERSMGWYWAFFTQPETGYIPYRDRASSQQASGELILKNLLEGKEVNIQEGSHYIMSNLGGPFTSMFEYRHLIHDAWSKMINKPEKYTFNNSLHFPVLAVHLRRGDFRIKGLSADLKSTEKLLNKVCHDFTDYHIYLMTDADAKDYSFWQIIPDRIENATTGNTVMDLLFLSRVDYLIGTANSSYSRFAAFLGGMPVSWIGPEQDVYSMSKLYAKSVSLYF
ncbi:MAG: hypothetical protein NTX45_26885 [Proteobacteria bacterium]|nr:hypothetical protein [Pseudomonadota bacterium]